MSLNISQSLIKDYFSCPRKVYFRLNKPDVSIQTDDMLVGTLVHEIIEHHWEDEAFGIQLLNSKLDASTMPDTMRKKAVAALKNFYREYSVLLHSSDQAEKYFKLPLIKNHNVYLTGKIDRILRDGTVIDWKTGWQCPKTVDMDPQFVVYYEAYKRLTGAAPKKVWYVSLIKKKVVEYTHSEEVAEDIFSSVIPSMVAAIQTQTLPRIGMYSKDEIVCSNCSFYSACRPKKQQEAVNELTAKIQNVLDS